MIGVDELGNTCFISEFTQDELQSLLKAWWYKNTINPSIDNTNMFNSIIASKQGIINICNYIFLYNILGLPINILELFQMGNAYNIMTTLFQASAKVGEIKLLDVNKKRAEMLQAMYQECLEEKKESERK